VYDLQSYGPGGWAGEILEDKLEGGKMQFDYRGILGPDISFYQGNPRNNLFVDFEKMKAWRNEDGHGPSFVIVKAGQRDYPDPAFAYNWTAAKAAGLLRAAYWFLDDERDGKSQAQYFWNLLRADPGEGPLVVDFEQGSGEDWNKLYDFLVEIQRLSGYPTSRIWIYTAYYYWMDHGPRTQAERLWFLRHPLWLAWYTEDPEDVLVPYPWIEAVMWQKGTPVLGLAMGAHSLEIDYNEFNGDIAEFTKYWNVNAGDPVEPEPEEPNEGGNMQYKVVWSRGASVRPEPAISNDPLATLAVNAIVDVVQDHIPDMDDPTNENKQWVRLTSGLFVASDYPDSLGVPRVRLEKIVEPVPAPEQRAFSFKVEGYKEVSGYLEPE
jgi:GH25 family lysozyme M1 (1,4-beta-N-acetylmuramidase)